MSKVVIYYIDLIASCMTDYISLYSNKITHRKSKIKYFEKEINVEKQVI